ncbi:hypothetical protein [Virgibacillus indicus]|nr:hypothetical protein [Virgibacillus indicus]
MKSLKILLSILIIAIFMYSTKEPFVSAEDDYPEPLNEPPIDGD